MGETEIGNRIKLLRDVLRITQIDFADMINISRPLLSMIERNKSIPTLETLKKIYTTFDVSPEYFFEPGSPLPGGWLSITSFEVVKEMNKRLGREHIPIVAEPNNNETMTLSKLGTKYKKHLKNDINIHHRHLSEILKSLERITDLSEILNDFLPIITIENIEDVSIYEKLIKDLPANSPISAGYEIYKTKTIEYLKSLLPYKASIATFEKQLMDFLKKMKDLDKNNEIHLPEE